MVKSFTRNLDGNHFRYICPVLGIERRYADDIRLHEGHMKGHWTGPAIIHTMMRASKDPTAHMLRYEFERGEEVFFDADPNSPPKTLPKAIIDRVKSVIIPECFYTPGLTDEDKTLIVEINSNAVPADSRGGEKPKAANGKGKVNMGHRRQVERSSGPAPSKSAEEGELTVTTDYAAALNKVIERETKSAGEPAAKRQEAPKSAPAPAAPPKAEKPVSAPETRPSEPAKTTQPAGAPKLSLLEMAKRMKQQQAA